MRYISNLNSTDARRSQHKARRLVRPATPLTACVQRTSLLFLPYAGAIYRMSAELNSVLWINQEKFVAMATSLETSKNNFSLIICRRSSTNPANLTKIDPVDVEMFVLKGIVEIRDSSRTYNPRACLAWRTKQRNR